MVFISLVFCLHWWHVLPCKRQKYLDTWASSRDVLHCNRALTRGRFGQSDCLKFPDFTRLLGQSEKLRKLWHLMQKQKGQRVKLTRGKRRLYIAILSAVNQKSWRSLVYMAFRYQADCYVQTKKCIQNHTVKTYYECYKKYHFFKSPHFSLICLEGGHFSKKWEPCFKDSLKIFFCIHVTSPTMYIACKYIVLVSTL